MPEFGHARQLLLVGMILALPLALAHAEAPKIAPASLPRIGTIDQRFQSYNVEMVGVTGGNFWKPYGEKPLRPPEVGPARAALDLYAYRPPTDLTNARLRRLAAALAPAYLRVSGTWSNATYFPDSDDAPAAPPTGFDGVLTHRQWSGVIDFAKAVGAQIVTSFATSRGTRDATGAWTPEQARSLLAYTRSLGGSIAAAEFMNEPDLVSVDGKAEGYSATEYGRDFRTFLTFMKQTAPEVIILGHGTIGTTATVSDLFAAAGPGIDAVSYHYYGALSVRCSGTQTPEAATSDQWLSRTGQTLAFYRTIRDRLEPGKPIWLTETGEAACGGDPWASTFLDTFRYLDQLGRLARAGVQVVMHNTLAASDYGLLDERTLAPRPNYWGALLWRRLMGITVLDPGMPVRAGFHVYAHCQRETPGGVALLVINTDRRSSQALTLPTASERYTLDAPALQGAVVRLNGNSLDLEADDELPHTDGAPTDAGVVKFAPATITFLTIPTAGNKACRSDP
jgi:hypothetical protein